MGSGKGRSRRTQVVGAAAKQVTFEIAKWDGLLEDMGVSNVNLHQYYLGGAPQHMTNAGYEKLIAELFSDAVLAGAIILPSGRNVDDFEFLVVMHGGYVDALEIDLKGKGSLKDPLYFNAEHILR